MSKLGIVLLVLVIAVIVIFWGSIASAALTLALFLAGIYILWHRLVTDRGDDDYWLEDG